MEIQVLISCMTDNVLDLLSGLNLQTNAVVVNQCDRECEEVVDYLGKNGKTYIVKIINTKERGLSKSRNKAIVNSSGDICLLCDEDEVFVDGYDQKIAAAYEKYKNADLILMDVRFADTKKTLTVPEGKLSFRRILSGHSVQITFKRDRIVSSGVSFDEKMGAGTGNGAAEEIKFMLGLRRKKRQLYSNNTLIAELKPSESTWFKGYDSRYFQNLGWATRRWAGFVVGYTYIWYYMFSHRYEYRGHRSTIDVLCDLHKGFFSKR